MDEESRGDDVGKSWEVSATRALCRTFLFDSGQAILFHPEKGNSGDSSPDEGENESWGKMTGDEAKQFYENVLSMPKQVVKTESTKPTGSRTSQHAYRRRRKTGVIDKNKNGEVVSLSQLFRFA